MGGIDSWTVEQLRRELKMRGYPVKGKKAELYERLNNPAPDEEQEKAKPGNDGYFTIIWAAFIHTPFVPYLTVFILMTAGGGVISFLTSESVPDYELIDFDTDRSRAFAQDLVDLGHPEWGGRMSGTIEEAAAAESNKQNFTDAGMGATIERFSVPMFEILAEPILRMCQTGGIVPPIDPCGISDIGSDITEFTHREQFVIQGYSGTQQINFAQNVAVIDLGNGSEDSDWDSASGGVGMVWGKGDVSGNTDLFLRAQESDLFALIIVNERQNCDDLISGDCVPYFKSVDVSRFDTMPAGIAFLMVSKTVGETISEEIINGSQRIGLDVRVDNEGTRDVSVPCGVIPGLTDDMIIFGAHHDTVYNGPGAVDDTSGTATVLELATQFGALYNDLGTPEYTIKFCTWGGEEEGLFGSKAWVEAHQEELKEHLRIYINLDMNHVDAERNNGVTLFGNSEEDVIHIYNIREKFNETYPSLASKYDAKLNLLDSSDMPYNSDHAPFVFEIDPDGEYGKALVCYGSGSSEYHTYLDGMDRFNEESLAVSGIIYGSYARWLAWGTQT
ncbi:MAG TPA: M20/M25/M40 family metallo-hydrolase [Candidatus Thalassarchaeaceae archaeon]|nr:M20/M25/M40 family metallo-hydrolase [Candidatus Thalassarchaeaceae archaeon]